ncbi:MAG: NUDIX domain-containing protein [Muribaculum sp.]|nr:NUDIX domain-containing protein [Muribaculum sp.]
MDIEYETPNMKFSLRSAALIFKNTHVLLLKSDCHHCFYTVGGGIRENETSESAVIRECYEETGYHFEIDRLVFIEERFFSVDNANHREIDLVPKI